MVKLHTKLGKPIPSTEPSMVAQTSSMTSTSKTTTATLSSTSSSLCSTSTTSSSGPSYLKPVNIVSAAVGGVKNPLASNPSAVGNAAVGKKVGAPKINFVGEPARVEGGGGGCEISVKQIRCRLQVGINSRPQ